MHVHAIKTMSQVHTIQLTNEIYKTVSLQSKLVARKHIIYNVGLSFLVGTAGSKRKYQINYLIPTQ